MADQKVGRGKKTTDIKTSNTVETMVKYMDVRSLKNFVVGGPVNCIGTGEHFWPLVLKTFREQHNGLITIDRQDLETGSADELLKMFGEFATGLSLNYDVGGELEYNLETIDKQFRIISESGLLQNLTYLSITDVAYGDFASKFIHFNYMELPKLLEFHLKVTPDRGGGCRELKLDNYPNLEVLICDGMMLVSSHHKRTRPKFLRKVSLKIFNAEHTVGSKATLRECIQLADIEVIDENSVLENFIIQLVRNANTHKTLKRLRFVGVFTTGLFGEENTHGNIAPEIGQLAELVDLDIRLGENTESHIPGELCTEDNITILLQLKKLERLILLESKEAPSNGMVHRLFANLPKLSSLVIKRITTESEREAIKEFCPGYRRIDKYTSVVDDNVDLYDLGDSSRVKRVKTH